MTYAQLLTDALLLPGAVLEHLPWWLIGLVLLGTPILVRLPGLVRYLNLPAWTRARSRARIDRAVAERIKTATPEQVAEMLRALPPQPAEHVDPAREQPRDEPPAPPTPPPDPG